jgi:nicotinate-nucleotide adenylyltransferase
MRVVMYGGAFDPPHRFHVALVKAAAASLVPDQLRVIPTGGAWHRAVPLLAAGHRFAMCQLAFAELPRVQVDDRELRRPGPTYTWDTLMELRREFPTAELALIVGEDQALALETWRSWQEIVRCATIYVAKRHLGASVKAHFLLDFMSKHGLKNLAVEPDPVSATFIRQQAAQGLALEGLVHPDVARYIANHHLYIQTP